MNAPGRLAAGVTSVFPVAPASTVGMRRTKLLRSVGAVVFIAVALIGASCVSRAGTDVAAPFNRMNGPSSAQGAGSTLPEDNCPVVGKSRVTWPPGVPVGVPLPNGSHIDSTRSANGTHRVEFELQISFGDAVRLYLAQLIRNGFSLGAGEAEAARADIPFRNDERELTLELTALADPCKTEGVLIVGPESSR